MRGVQKVCGEIGEDVENGLLLQTSERSEC